MIDTDDMRAPAVLGLGTCNARPYSLLGSAVRSSAVPAWGSGLSACTPTARLRVERAEFVVGAAGVDTRVTPAPRQPIAPTSDVHIDGTTLGIHSPGRPPS